MPSVNLSEAEFDVLAKAANDALDAGEEAQAQALDKMARKLNAALSKGVLPPLVRNAVGKRDPFSWKDVPSTLVRPWPRP